MSDISRIKHLIVGYLTLIHFFCFSQDTILQIRTLDFYLEQGINNSPLLKDNFNSLQLNKLDSLINIAINKPFVQSSGQYLYAPAANTWGYDENITNGGQYTGLVQVTRNLLYRKNLKIQNRLNSALKDSVVNTIRINQNDLKKAIIDLYLISFQDYMLMTVYDDLFTAFSQQNAILKELLKSAFFTQADYLNFRIDMQQSEISRQMSKIQYLQDLLTLNILCNINDTTIVILEEPKLTQKPVFSLDNNPYLLKYKYDSIIIERNRRMVDIFYRPKLNLTADAGINSIQFTNISKNYGYSILLDFSIPIYNGNQRKLQYHKFDIDLMTLRYYREQYIIKLNLKIKTITEQLKANRYLLDLTEKQNTDIENLLSLSKIRLYNGDMSAIDYSLIIQKYLNTKINLIQLRIQNLKLISEFNYRSW
jgi:outer membrane protein TolC